MTLSTVNRHSSITIRQSQAHLVVVHRVGFVRDLARRAPFATKFTCIGNDIAVASDGADFELLVPIDLAQCFKKSNCDF